MANGNAPAGESDNLFLKSQRINPDSQSMLSRSVIAPSPSKWKVAMRKRRMQVK